MYFKWALNIQIRQHKNFDPIVPIDPRLVFMLAPFLQSWIDKNNKKSDPIVSRLVFIVGALPLTQQTDDRSDSFGLKDHPCLSKKEMLLIDDSDNLEFLSYAHVTYLSKKCQKFG